MRRPFGLITVVALVIFLISDPSLLGDDSKSAFHYNRLLGRGVNLGNALEAPREGAWGVTLKEEYFSQIRAAGFDSVRIPIRWSVHAANASPFNIDPAFFERVDWAVTQALRNRLAVVINVHHYDEVFEDPHTHRNRLIAIWEQIAHRYKNQSDYVFFELLNEPHENLTYDVWNDLLRDLLTVVRKTNRNRIVIVGPASWNNPSQLPRLELPAGDQRLIVTFHYYSPFPFTHQGAGWVEQGRTWQDIRWAGWAKQRQEIATSMQTAAEWAERENRPLYLGEFGSYHKADMESRVRWTRCVREEAEQRGISWAYWEFAAGFGVYDPAAGGYREELLNALVPRQSSGEK